MKNKDASSAAHAATSQDNSMLETPLAFSSGSGPSHRGFDQSMVNALCQEVLKSLQGKSMSNYAASESFSSSHNFAGIAQVLQSILLINHISSDDWIIDTGGATDHMVTKPDKLLNKRFLDTPICIGLSNGSTASVTETGNLP